MPHHVIEVHTFTHTCRGNPLVHVIETWRALVETTHTPCTNPQRVELPNTVTYVDCGRVLRPEQRCPG